MLTDVKGLMQQLADTPASTVHHVYLLLAEAAWPNGLLLRPSGHGVIKHELRFEHDNRWLYSAVLYKNVVTWYFRKPALRLKPMSASDPEFVGLDVETNNAGEIKVLLRTESHAMRLISIIQNL